MSKVIKLSDKIKDKLRLEVVEIFDILKEDYELEVSITEEMSKVIIDVFDSYYEKKEIIFNEDRIQWDADITLVEGAFDHIVVPNSIPLLGKALDKDYKLYWDIITKANAKVNVWLDGDAYGTVKEIYKLLNHGRLYDKVRYIPVGENDDPSSLYQKGGYKEIARHLSNAQQIKEVYLY